MPINDELGSRMKNYYESIPKTKLMRRTPVAIRIDGKAFHTFTRGFAKPFDEVLGNAMVRTMEYLCRNIQGCVFGYTQSDEITLLLIDYQTFETDAWFDYEVQKMCSIAASMATMAFNKFFAEEMNVFKASHTIFDTNEWAYPEAGALYGAYMLAKSKGAMFDARCFNIPKEEVTNLVYWRQLDAQRNSVQMVGQANYSPSYLQNKTCAEIKELLQHDFGINWDGLPARWKHGVAWTKETGIDWDMPILKGEDRKYVDNLIFVGE